MLFQPVIGLLLSCHNLGTGHPRGKQGDPVLASRVSTGLGQNGPEIGFIQVRRNASSSPIVTAQLTLSEYMPLLSSEGEPAEGLGVVLLDFQAGSIVRS